MSVCSICLKETRFHTGGLAFHEHEQECMVDAFPVLKAENAALRQIIDDLLRYVEDKYDGAAHHDLVALYHAQEARQRLDALRRPEDHSTE